MPKYREREIFRGSKKFRNAPLLSRGIAASNELRTAKTESIEEALRQQRERSRQLAEQDSDCPDKTSMLSFSGYVYDAKKDRFFKHTPSSCKLLRDEPIFKDFNVAPRNNQSLTRQMLQREIRGNFREYHDIICRTFALERRISTIGRCDIDAHSHFGLAHTTDNIISINGKESRDAVPRCETIRKCRWNPTTFSPVLSIVTDNLCTSLTAAPNDTLHCIHSISTPPDDMIRTVEWEPSGQYLLVGTSSALRRSNFEYSSSDALYPTKSPVVTLSFKKDESEKQALIGQRNGDVLLFDCRIKSRFSILLSMKTCIDHTWSLKDGLSYVAQDVTGNFQKADVRMPKCNLFSIYEANGTNAVRNRRFWLSQDESILVKSLSDGSGVGLWDMKNNGDFVRAISVDKDLIKNQSWIKVGANSTSFDNAIESGLSKNTNIWHGFYAIHCDFNTNAPQTLLSGFTISPFNEGTTSPSP